MDSLLRDQQKNNYSNGKVQSFEHVLVTFYSFFLNILYTYMVWWAINALILVLVQDCDRYKVYCPMLSSGHFPLFLMQRTRFDLRQTAVSVCQCLKSGTTRPVSSCLLELHKSELGARVADLLYLSNSQSLWKPCLALP